MENKTPKPPEYLDLQGWMGDLMAELGFDKVEPEKQDRLWKSLWQQVNHVVMAAVTQNLDPETLDQVLADHAGDKDIQRFMDDLIRETPMIQIAILDSLNDLREKMIEITKKDRKPME